MPTRQSTHADRGLLPWFDSPAHPQQHLKDRSSGSHGRGIGSAWITAYSPATLFPMLDRLEKKAIWDHRSKGMAVKAARVSQKPQGPARYGGSEGQRVASDSASLIAKNGFANFMDGADRNELAVATLLWQRQQGQQ